MPFLSQHNNMYRRTLAFALAVIAGWVFLIVRLFGLQVTEHDKYQSIVIDQLTRETKTTPERGKIFDTNMNLLVTNTTVYRVFVSPRAINKYEGEDDVDDEFAPGEISGLITDKLVEVLGVDRAETLEKMTAKNKKGILYQDRTIMKNVEPETAQILREFIDANDLDGLLNLGADSKRYYCYGNLACHLGRCSHSAGGVDCATNPSSGNLLLNLRVACKQRNDCVSQPRHQVDHRNNDNQHNRNDIREALLICACHAGSSYTSRYTTDSYTTRKGHSCRLLDLEEFA